MGNGSKNNIRVPSKTLGSVSRHPAVEGRNAAEAARFEHACRRARDVMGKAQTMLVLWLALGMCPERAVADPTVPPVAVPILTVGVEPGPGPRARFSRDLFAAVAQTMGASIVWVEVAREEALAGLMRSRYDVAAGPFAPNEATGLALLAPVVLAGDGILKRRGDGGLQKPADIAGKAIALIGPPAETVGLRALLAALHARLPRRSGLMDPLADLAAGRLAALAGPLEAVAAARLAQPELFDTVGPPFGQTGRLAPVTRPGPLADRISAALGRMRADGSLATLQQRWFGLVFDPPDALPVQPAPTDAPPAPNR